MPITDGSTSFTYNSFTMSIALLKASTQDKDYLFELRLLTMVDHLAIAGIWLSVEEHWLRVNKHFDAYHLIVHDAIRVGAVKYSEADGTLNIMQLQIHPDFQGCGIGKNVLNLLIKRTVASTISLTVLKANPVKRLYERMGFRVIGEDEFEFHMERPVQSNN